MSFIYAAVDALEGTAKVGSTQCVVLVQTYAKAPKTSSWKEGAVVRGNQKIAKGTGIATFVGGKYPNASSGNHAALYICQDASGIKVMDQWSGPSKPKVSSRVLKFKGKNKAGGYTDPSNNGDSFSVIE